MAYEPTIEEVREFLGDAYADVPDSTIETYMCVVAQMNDCLDANYTSECIQKAIVINAISHFVVMASGKFIKSQTAPSGASQSFDLIMKAEGLKITNYGRALEMLDTAQCFTSLFPSGSFSLGGLGRKNCRC